MSITLPCGNKKAGGDRDGFTIWDFLSMMAYHEAGFDTSFAMTMAEAGVRFFYERAETLKTPTTVEYLLDWWVRFSESTARLIKSGANSVLHIDIKVVRRMGVVGNAFRNPSPAWQQGWAYDRPFNWGNASILSVDTVKMYEANQHALFIRITGQRPKDTFYIPSGCAWLNWQSKDNYDVSCSPVP